MVVLPILYNITIHKAEKSILFQAPHGTPDGKTAFGSNWLLRFMHRDLREIKHYNQDKDLASKYNNVEVYDIIELSTKKIKEYDKWQ